MLGPPGRRPRTAGQHARREQGCEAGRVGQYTHETKYGPVDIHTKSIDDGWVASVDPAQVSVPLPPDDGPVPLLEEEAVERLLQRIERS
jgi:hypothetical protein